MKEYEDANGTRLLDYLDVHMYPQAAGVTLAGAGDAATQARRLRSVRSLWDPSYVDESWIADAGPDGGIVRLVPRLREWVDAQYPGTKIAITEYNWGGFESLNGALAQADILGIFGREGVDLATFFDTPYSAGAFTPASPAAFAFRVYRNYDGAGARFGETSVAATSGDPATLSIYAAERASDGTLTIVVINKTGTSLTRTVSLAGALANGSARAFRYSGADLGQIVALPDVGVAGGFATTQFPASSITLLEVPAPEPSALLTGLAALAALSARRGRKSMPRRRASPELVIGPTTLAHFAAKDLKSTRR
jgi:hypothetical protein